MIGLEDAPYTYEYDDYFKILPCINNWGFDKERIKQGKKVNDEFSYASNTNKQWMSDVELNHWLQDNSNVIGKL